MKKVVPLFFTFTAILLLFAPLSFAYSVPSSTIVYVTPTGSKYHRENCSYITNGARSLTIAVAEATGYTACSRCDPDVLTGKYNSPSSESSYSASSNSSLPMPQLRLPENNDSSTSRTNRNTSDKVQLSELWLGVFASSIAVNLFFIPPLLMEKAKTKQHLKNIDLEAGAKAIEKVKRLNDGLSKGYLQSPITGKPMKRIEDLIEYVERYNEFKEQEGK